MTSPPPEAAEMEPPECPVCLQSYNTDDTIPRVLACGHSACETCLAQLPRSLSHHVIRCPECTQLVKLPHPQGPTALPKNIDLLRLSPSYPKTHSRKSSTPVVESPQRRRFPPQIWSDEVYTAWKDWVLPDGAVLVEEDGSSKIRISSNSLESDLGLSPIMRCRIFEDQKVSFVEIGRFLVDETLLEYGYVGKVMSVLGCMSDVQRTELGKFMSVSLRNNRVCNILGLWLDVKSGSLYLVTERRNDGLLNLDNLQCGFDREKGEWVPCLSSIGVELCEALIGLQSEGFVFGCLGVSCFRFDEFGHVYIELGEALMAGRKIRECVAEGIDDRQRMDGAEAEEIVMNMSNTDAFVSPEVLFGLLHKEGIEIENSDMDSTVDCRSDVWLLACVLIRLLTGKKFAEGMYNYLRSIFERKSEALSECKTMYLQWLEMINTTMLETSVGSGSLSLQDIFLKCLVIDPGSRPLISDVWKSIRGFTIYHHMAGFSGVSMTMRVNVGPCLFLGELCNLPSDLSKDPRISKLNEEHDHCADPSQVGEARVDNVVQELCAGKVRCKDLRGHLDCITGLCLGGGYLFSSSFDKTINVWSLQDFTHVHTFRGHEHRVMAVVFVDQEKPLCISADSSGGIFSWEVMAPFRQEPLKKWYEEKDWRYSGIHALAVSESGYLYTGSGDRLIKAWSLKDHTLLCSMEGHKSVVSTLALCNGVLYSGSWDGTLRLWCLHDHSPLAVLGEDMPGMVSSVLSLHADQNLVIAAHENGQIKIWMNDVLKASRKVHGGAILALAQEEKWMFTGGWDRTVKFQEIREDGLEMDAREVGSIPSDSVITALLYVGGILFVGFANRLIKVYHC